MVEIVDKLIAQAATSGASDIHLEPEREHFYCRYRIDGVLQDMPALPKNMNPLSSPGLRFWRIWILPSAVCPRTAGFPGALADKNIDLRVSTFPTLHGENLVIRILDKTRSLLRLEDLGVPPGALNAFEQIIRRPHGVVLVTGPTGSGKTTTLYAVLSRINCLEKNIITLEDPIEYEIKRVRQSQINR